RLRILLRRIHGALRGNAWFPHIPLAILLGAGGIWLLQSDLGDRWGPFLVNMIHGQVDISPNLLPPLLIGTGMLIMAGGLLLRSRLAWTMALLLAATAAVSMFFGQHQGGHLLLAYFILILALLPTAWRRSHHPSLAPRPLTASTQR